VVPYQLGAAWALDKQLLLVLDPALPAQQQYLPLQQAESAPLNPDSLMELAFSLASSAGLQTDLSHATRLTLGGLFPSWDGLERQSGERLIDDADQTGPAHRTLPETPAADARPATDTQQLWPVGEDTQPEVLPSVPPPAGPAEQTAPAEDAASEADPTAASRGNGKLPSRDDSLAAGRAMSDCMFHREQGGPFAPELDAPFGGFLSALGGPWQALRELEDLDLWMETADNLLQGLDADDAHLRSWYEMGFQLSTLLNLASDAEDLRTDEQASEVWDGAFKAFAEAAKEAGVGGAALIELEGMLDNLQGPEGERDFTLVGRVQERVRDLAQASQ
jgi:hypothetical protein